MKSASTALQTLLAGRDFVYADLYTITLPSSAQILLCGGDRLVRATGTGELITDTGNRIVTNTGAGIQITTANGAAYPIGCPISDGGIKAKIGLDPNTVDITILADDSIAFYNGETLQDFLYANGLNGASIRIDRAYSPSWEYLLKIGPTGTINRFSGFFGVAKSISRTQAVISAYPWTDLLNTDLPANVYQASCLHTLFDTGCGLSRAAYAISGVVGVGSTVTTVATNLTQAAGYFTLGKVQFTSGANNGQQRTVKTHDGAGDLILVQGLSAAPAAGDTFTIYPGCDLSQSTCTNKFNNLLKFRGFPLVPPPEASL
jgi:hypothetical protein